MIEVSTTPLKLACFAVLVAACAPPPAAQRQVSATPLFNKLGEATACVLPDGTEFTPQRGQADPCAVPECAEYVIATNGEYTCRDPREPRDPRDPGGRPSGDPVDPPREDPEGPFGTSAGGDDGDPPSPPAGSTAVGDGFSS